MSSGKQEATRRERQQRRRHRDRQRRSERRPPASDTDPADAQTADGAGGDETDGTTQTDADEGVQVSRVLVRKGASFEDFSKLDHATSIESKIARGRGRAEFAAETGERDSNPMQGSCNSDLGKENWNWKPTT